MCRSACQPKIAELVHVRPTCYINYHHTTLHYTTLHYNQPILLSHDLYDGRHTCWTTAAREVGERVLGGRVLGDRVAGDRVRALFVGGARREAEAARGGGGGGARLLFFVLRAYGSPAIMAPYFCYARGAERGGGCFFLSCAHMGVPRSWHPILFLAFLRCAHLGVPRSRHPIFCLRARVAEASTITSYLGSCWDTSR